MSTSARAGCSSSSAATSSSSGRDALLFSARHCHLSARAIHSLNRSCRVLALAPSLSPSLFSFFPPSTSASVSAASTSAPTSLAYCMLLPDRRTRSRGSARSSRERLKNRSACVQVAVLPAVSSSPNFNLDQEEKGEMAVQVTAETSSSSGHDGGEIAEGPAGHHLQQEQQSHGGVSPLLELLKCHQSAGTTPPSATCIQLFKGHVKQGFWRDVWACYQLLEAQQVQLDRAAYAMLWERAMKESKLDSGVDVFRRMGELYGCPEQREYVTIISRILKSRKKRSLPYAQLAYDMWGELRSAWGPILDVVSYRSGVNACVENGKLDEALQIIRKMRASNLRPGRGSFNMIIKYHCKSGDMDSARQVLRQRHELGFSPDLISFNTLISGYVGVGDLKMARAVLDRAGYEGLQPDVISYSSYIHGAAKLGDLREAQATLDEMMYMGVKPNEWTFSGMLEAHIRFGDLTGAEELLAGMEAKANVKPNTVMYNVLIRAYGSMGNSLGYDHCLRLLVDMQKAGVRPGVDTYSTLMDAAMKAGLGQDSVLSLLEQLKSAGLEPDGVVWTSLMKMYQREGEHQNAGKPFVEMEATPNTYTDLMALNMLVHVYSSSGNMSAAEAATRSAARYAHQQSMRPPVEAFNALIQGYHRQGQLPPLLATLRRFLRLGGRPHAGMAETVVNACLKYGDPRTALQAIRAMQLAGLDSNCFDRCRELVYQYQVKVEEGGVRKGGKGGSKRREDAMWFERLKWFVGLPNSYYESDWR